MINQQNELWQKILDQPYCDPMKRMDFVLFFDVRDGNPNGDPDAGNLPRMDPQTRHGIVTDVCIKRKVRDYLSVVLKQPIFIQSQEALNTLIFRSARELSERKEIEIMPIEITVSRDEVQKFLTKNDNKTPSEDDIDKVFTWLNEFNEGEHEGLEYDSENGKLTYFGEAKKSGDFVKLLIEEDEPTETVIKTIVNKLSQALSDAKKNAGGGKLSQKVREKVKDEMCKKYYDIRFFGAVLTAGTNFGQVRGPMQLTFARSIEPILQMDAAITRCAITKEADRARKQTEFGRKSWLNWAVYKQHGFFNPLLGQQTGIKKEDLARFWEALACMFRNSDAASKGEMTMHDIIVFVHDHPRGNAPSHLLFDKIKCETKSIKTIEEKPEVKIIKRDGFDTYYEISTPGSLNSGVKVFHPLDDIWK
ncbi:MAG: type I CRISPR-associated protein Cas7 [Bacteroidota bacterium]